MNPQTSKCCNAHVTPVCDEEGTGYNKCQKCGEGCDLKLHPIAEGNGAGPPLVIVKGSFPSGYQPTTGQTPTEEMQKLLHRKKVLGKHAGISSDETDIVFSYIRSLEAQCSTLQSKVEEQNLLIQGKNAFARILDEQIATLQAENEKLQYKYNYIREWAAEREKEKDEKIATLQDDLEINKNLFSASAANKRAEELQKQVATLQRERRTRPDKSAPDFL